MLDQDHIPISGLLPLLEPLEQHHAFGGGRLPHAGAMRHGQGEKAVQQDKPHNGGKEQYDFLPKGDDDLIGVFFSALVEHGAIAVAAVHFLWVICFAAMWADYSSKTVTHTGKL